MNEQTILDDEGTASGIVVTSNAQEGLKMAATWSTFLSILGFIMAGFMVLAAIIMTMAMGAIGDTGMMPFPAWILPVFYIGLTVLMVIIYLNLYRFATRTKSALSSGNSAQLEIAMMSLGKFFKIVGIITIIFLVLYLLAIMSMGSLMSMFGAGNF